MPFKYPPAEDRLWAKVVAGPNGCQLWTGSTTDGGYGHFKADGEFVLVHRFAWKLATGHYPPDGILVCHECDVRRCVRFSHLFLGTHQTNMDDMIDKGRKTWPSGADHPRAKLTEADVAAIREEYAVLRTTKAELARRFGVTGRTVGLLITGKTWKGGGDVAAT